MSKNALISASLLAFLAVIVFSLWDDRAPSEVSGDTSGETADVSAEEGITTGHASSRKVTEVIQSWIGSRSDPAVRESILETLREDRAAYVELMQSDPAAALSRVVPLDEWSSLPEELKPFYPRVFSTVGDIDLLWEIGEAHSHADEGRHRCCFHKNKVIADGEILKAYGADRGILPVVYSAPLGGVRIGDTVLVTDSPVVAISAREVDAAGALFDSRSGDVTDPITGVPVENGEVALIGGSVFHFQRSDLLEHVDSTLAANFSNAAQERSRRVDQPFSWLAASGGGFDESGATGATPYMTDHIDVLFIRVDFDDFPGAPVSKADLEATLATVAGHIDDFSYGVASLTSTVTTQVYRMPSNGATYAVAGNNDGLIADARAAAAANYTLGNYDVVAVYFPNLGGVTNSKIKYGGLASIGGGNHWINGFNNVDIILHEFGHNYGLYHANYYDPSQSLGSSLDYDVPGSLEYGDIFDVMGGADAPEGHFSHLAKNHLKWMPDSKVTEATTNGTYRIYRFDHASALSNPSLALKIPVEGDVNYWVGFRQLFPSAEFNLSNGAYVVADNLSQARETNLIDMTPDSSANESTDRKDAGLVVGDSLVVGGGAVTIETVATGGSEPNQWIDVSVEFSSRLGFAASSLEVDEQQGVARVVVERTFGTAGMASVNYATSAPASGSIATAGTDYYATSGTLAWANGEAGAKTILIPLRPDVLAEGREDFLVTLSGASGAVLDSSLSETTVSILDPATRFAGFAPGFFNTSVSAIVPLDSGKLIIGGSISGGIGDANTIRHIARLDANGAVDTSFVTGTGFDSEVSLIYLEDSGSMLVAGSFTSYNGTACNGLVRLDANGSIDSTFAANIGTGAPGLIEALAVELDGDILVGGSFSSFNGVSAPGIIRLGSNGQVKGGENITPAFINGSPSINSIIVEPGGTIMIAGSFWFNYSGGSIDGFRAGVARLNPNGTRNSSFEAGAGLHTISSRNSLRTGTDLMLLNSGRYCITGSFTAYDGNEVSSFVVVNPDGSYVSGTAPGMFNANPRSALAQDSDKIIVGGGFTTPTNYVGRLTAEGIVDTTFAVGLGTTGDFGNRQIYSIADDGDGGIYLGGNFFSYQGESTRPVIRVAGGASPYEIWAARSFSSAQFLAGLTDPEDDPDNDDLTNEDEMALGTNPNVANRESAFGFGETGGLDFVEIGGARYLQLTLDKSALSDGAWFAAQFSDDLITWSPTTPTAGPTAAYTIIRNTEDELVVRDNTPTTSANRRFARFAIVTPQ